jgi:hypothetical protein
MRGNRNGWAPSDSYFWNLVAMAVVLLPVTMIVWTIAEHYVREIW